MPDDPLSAPEPRIPPQRDPRPPERLATDIALQLGFLGLFLYLALDLIRPFAGLALWTVVVAAALHPAFCRTRERLGGRARMAAALVTLAALVVMLGPIAALGASLVHSIEWLIAHSRGGTLQLPEAPPALIDLPGIGPSIADNWTLATSNLEAFLERYARTLISAGEAAARPALRFVRDAAILLAAVALSGFLHRPAPRLGDAARRGARRLVGARGAGFVDVAAATIRNVARGVIGVAVIQSLAIGAGLFAAGVPAAGLLTLAALVLAIVQLSTLPVIAPVLVWAWLERETGTAALMTAWLLPASLLDVPLKPLMLGASRTAPTLVILAGVIGGTLAYGLIGLFVGPILLAIAYEVGRAAIFEEPPPGRGGME